MKRVLLAFVLTLALATPAQAHIESGNYLRGAYAGQAAFGDPPQCAPLHIHRGPWDPGWWGYYNGCVIQIAGWLTDHSDWQARCTIIVHEWGHSRGYGHSSDPYNVMYSPYWGYNYWRCT